LEKSSGTRYEAATFRLTVISPTTLGKTVEIKNGAAPALPPPPPPPPHPPPHTTTPAGGGGGVSSPGHPVSSILHRRAPPAAAAAREEVAPVTRPSAWTYKQEITASTAPPAWTLLPGRSPAKTAWEWTANLRPCRGPFSQPVAGDPAGNCCNRVGAGAVHRPPTSPNRIPHPVLGPA
jgi:hypothetical protein